MPEGLQVWDESGRLIVDTTTLVGKLLGTTFSEQLSGYLDDERFLRGTPFGFVLPQPTSYNLGNGNAYNATVSNSVKLDFIGNRMRWSLTENEQYYDDIPGYRIYYGIY
ncbi:hypothetical protein [Idiomarina xiamenensis]|uniref:Uncharacterized protein n=1 Tax=Idiomarina xiamenensis 10-D-4 TaxID=740709 RepID=K2J988_9GAMM|nr:hypothetical protein [Idiomarina xiamenensis]EKE79731.1 hypothetical protein A10D4_12764 [Idiomarina xiamenensis 10-D-4]